MHASTPGWKRQEALDRATEELASTMNEAVDTLIPANILERNADEAETTY